LKLDKKKLIFEISNECSVEDKSFDYTSIKNEEELDEILSELLTDADFKFLGKDI